MRTIKCTILFCLFCIVTMAQYYTPESVIFDSNANRYLVSNSLSGTIWMRSCMGTSNAFISGLNQPMGMVIVGTRFFVTDDTCVKGYNLSNGAKVMNLKIIGSYNLWDIESNGSNYLYVSDLGMNKIFRIDISNIASPTYTTFVSSGIPHPIGLLYDGANNRLLVVSSKTNSSVEAVDLGSGSVSTVKTTTLANLHGITRDDSGYIYVSSWDSNSIYRFNSSFSTGPVLFSSGYNGPADIYFNNNSKVLVIPCRGTGTLAFVNLMNASISPAGSVFKCPGKNITLQANTGYCLYYYWERDGTHILPNSSTLSTSIPGTYTISITNAGGTSTSKPVGVNDYSINQPVISPSGTLNICLGDSIKLTSSKELKYLWSNNDTIQSIIVKSSGQYFVKTTDSIGCVFVSASVYVNVFPSVIKPVINKSGPTRFCYEDSVVLSCDSSFFNYHWSDNEITQNITIKTSGYYSLIISDTNNCFSYRSDTVHVEVLANPSKPLINITGKTGFCLGDSVVLNILSANFSYLWSDNDTNKTRIIKASGNYYAIAIDTSNCKSPYSDTVKVNVYPLPPKPTINELHGQPTKCEGDTAWIVAPLCTCKYFWSNGDTAARITEIKTGGKYAVRLQDSNSCMSPVSDSILILFVPKAPTPYIVQTSPDSLACSLMADHYSWYRENILLPVDNRKIKASDFNEGRYVVIINIYDFCPSDSSAPFIYYKTSLKKEFYSGYIKFYPVPADNELFIYIPVGDENINTISLLNSKGQVLKTVNQITSTTFRLDLKPYPEGLYFLNIIHSDIIYSFKFTIQK